MISQHAIDIKVQVVTSLGIETSMIHDPSFIVTSYGEVAPRYFFVYWHEEYDQKWKNRMSAHFHNSQNLWSPVTLGFTCLILTIRGKKTKLHPFISMGIKKTKGGGIKIKGVDVLSLAWKWKLNMTPHTSG